VFSIRAVVNLKKTIVRVTWVLVYNLKYLYFRLCKLLFTIMCFPAFFPLYLNPAIAIRTIFQLPLVFSSPLKQLTSSNETFVGVWTIFSGGGFERTVYSDFGSTFIECVLNHPRTSFFDPGKDYYCIFIRCFRTPNRLYRTLQFHDFIITISRSSDQPRLPGIIASINIETLSL
jgi:hypothetical protein